MAIIDEKRSPVNIHLVETVEAEERPENGEYFITFFFASGREVTWMFYQWEKNLYTDQYYRIKKALSI